MSDSFKTRQSLAVGGQSYEIYSLPAIQGHDLGRLPFSLKILLENLLRFEDGVNVTRADIEALLDWDAKAAPSHEIAFTPARVIMQDFTGVPCVVDLAAMREAMTRLGGNPQEINPLAPAELVIDHSVQVDDYGTADSLGDNNTHRVRAQRRALFVPALGPDGVQQLQGRAAQHRHRAPGEPRVPRRAWCSPTTRTAAKRAYPDTLVGTDSHTTMINGLGVLGWGVGGIEAEAAMLGQPVTMLIPQVIGFRLTGALPAGATATDLVLTVTEMLRKKGVVDKFVEFFGDGLADLPLADRATIANMAPEFGSTCGIFPIDEETIRYLELTGRPPEQIALVEAYAKAQGMWRTNGMREADYTDVLELDLATVEPSLAGPKRPQDRVPLQDAKDGLPQGARQDGRGARAEEPGRHGHGRRSRPAARASRLRDGAVLIAAITSCTNTSNPDVLMAAGLLARNARRRGLTVEALGEDQPGAGLARRHRLPRRPQACSTSWRPSASTWSATAARPASATPARCSPRSPQAVKAGDVIGCLGALRQPQLRRPRASGSEDELPRLAAAGRGLRARRHHGHRPEQRAARHRHRTASPCSSRTSGPPPSEIQQTASPRTSTPAMFKKSYASVFAGDENWQRDQGAAGQDLRVGADVHLRAQPAVLRRHDHDAGRGRRHPRRARAGAARRLGHDRPHLARRQHRQDEPGGEVPRGAGRAARRLQLLRRAPRQPRSDDARHLRQHPPAQPAAAGHRGRRHACTSRRGEQMSIYDAAMKYKAEGTPLVVLAGKEYGTGSSRDWAAKGTMLLGVKAVIAESFERIHRSNLIGMGVLPLQFQAGENAQIARAHRQGELRDHRAERRRREDGDRDRDARLAARRSGSRRACASTRRRSASTSSTAASCSTCCGSWLARARRPEGK